MGRILLQICISVNAIERLRFSQSERYNAAASEIMRTFLGVVELFLALLVMLGVLLQTPKASGLGGTIGGGGDSGGGYRTKRGLEKNLFYATIGLVVMFVVVSVVYIRV
jgi:protein translocase SecG subunit